jgi:toxin-antitoxin system PIN domain toxin
MTFLPDVNVWLALAVDGHPHHAAAKSWLDAHPSDALAFCRVTEMGLLRLLTNPKVMRSDALSPAAAWRVRDAFFADDRVTFLAEPPGFDALWRRVSASRQAAPNFWTDAYLLAFSRHAGIRLATFDRHIRHHPGVDILSTA